MSIKIKFIIVAVASLMVAIIVWIFIVQNNIIVEKEIAKERIASGIQKDLFERGVLRDEYFLYSDQRPLVQLNTVSKDLGQLLAQASGTFTSADDKESIFILENNKKLIDNSLSQIIAHPSPELAQQLKDQILVKSQDNNNIAEKLEEESRSNATKEQKRTLFFILMFIGVLSLSIALALYSIWLSIIKPLIKLKDFAERIASLDFTAIAAATPSNDEIGKLTHAFKTMVVKLKESYGKIDSYNQQLGASNQQFRAANQQLATSEINLKEKIKELEIFNKAAVGRELKMIELKEEIKKLKVQDK